MPENVEIERRFLIDGRFERPWVHEATECIEIKQWYLDQKGINVSSVHGAVMYKNEQLVSGLSQEVRSALLEEPDWMVRIRKFNSSFFLTLKGSRTGAAAAEFEWEIERNLENRSLLIRNISPSKRNATFGQTPTDLFGKLMSSKTILQD